MGLVHHPNVVSDGLIACWDAGNRVSYPGTGNSCTSPVNNVVSTLVNTPVFNPSKGGYFEFDGTNDCLRVTTTSTGYDAIDLTGTIVSLFAWVSRYNDTGYNPLICKRSTGCPQYEFNWYHSSGYNTGGTAKLVFECGGCGGTYSDTLSSVDQWRYVGVTYDGTTVRFYVDGEAWGTALLSNTMTSTTDPLRIANNHHEDATCDIAIAQMYNRVLTAAEVKQNYESLKPRFTPRITKSGMFANWDAGDPESYSGGQTWTDTANGFVGPFDNGVGEAISFDSANGGSLVFDGTDDCIGEIILPGDYSGTARSILLWVSPAADDQEMMAFNSADDKFKATVGQSTSYGKYIFRADVGESSPQTGSFADSLITVGDWACIGMTINASDEIVSMYLNGVSKTGGSQGWSFQDDTYIGRSSSGAPWYGKIATVRLYTKTLSAAEVMDNFQKTRGRFGV